jgi:tetratricopeptide (TPR) repeat protein
MVRREAGGDADSLDGLVRALDPDDFRNRVRALRADLDANDLRALEKSEKTEELPTRSLLLLADALGRSGDAVRAVALCRAAHRKDPFDFWTSFQLAFWLVRLSPPKTEEAVPYFSKALSQQPGSVAARYHLGEVLDPQKDPEWKLSIWREAWERDPDYGPLAKSLAAGLNQKGAMMGRSQRIDAAGECFEEALRLDPDNVVILRNLGMIRATQGDNRAAIPLLRRTAEMTPDSSRVQAGLGQILDRWGDYDAAEASYRKALDLAPGNLLARQLRAGVLAKLGRTDEAIAEYRTLLGRSIGNTQAHRSLGVLLSLRGDDAGAVTQLRQALGSQPLDYASHVSLIRVLRAAGDADGAEAAEAAMVETYRQAVRQGLNNVDWSRHLGWSLGRRHSREEAVAIYEELGTDRADVVRGRFHLSLGITLWSHQLDDTGCRESVQEALRLMPDYFECHREYARVLYRAAGWKVTDDVLAAARRAVELKPGEALSLDILSAYLEERLEYRKALGFRRRRLSELEKLTGHDALIREGVEVAEKRAELHGRAVELARSRNPAMGRIDRLAILALLTREGEYTLAVEQGKAVVERFPPDLGVEYLDRFRRADDLEATARAAALAAAEDGTGSEEARAQYRAQARTWLGEAVVIYRRILESPGMEMHQTVLREMRSLLTDRRYAPIRDSEFVEKLPAEEQAALRKLWSKVRRLWEDAK